MNIQDSTKFSKTPKDKTVKGEMEGGYTHARPRTTRANRMEYTTGFSSLTQQQCDDLMDFYEKVGGYTPFLWKVPVMSAMVKVRFDAPPRASYAGVGTHVRYDVGEIKLSEA